MKLISKLNAYVLALVLLFCIPMALAEDVDPLQAEFDQKSSQIASDNAAGHYELGLEMYRKYDGKGKKLKPLELAVKAFKSADGIFRVTLKDGTELTLNVDDSDTSRWDRVKTDYTPQLEDTYQLIHAKDKDTSKRKRSVEKFDSKNRREVLHKSVGIYAKANTVEEKALAIPVATMHRDAPRIYHLVSAELKSAVSAQNPDYWKMAFAVIGGLGIFLIGMKNMSEGVQGFAGNRLRRMINAVTDNRLMATGVGVGVTCMVQSSSITTVIVVGLVNSGLMMLHQAIGVVMGANIGTTITGWILALKIGKYGLPILGVSVLFLLFSKRDRVRYVAMFCFGLGMVFFGLEMMKNGFAPMKGDPRFTEAFQWFDAHTYIGVLKCAMVGCILTFIVQSSSATLGITIGLAMTGTIPFETAGALVLGENIGTTITAWLASIGATTNAKRAAYAHVMFNVIGVFWITLIYNMFYLEMIGSLVESAQGVNPVGLVYDEFPNKGQYALVVTVGIALVHTCFNVANTLIFLPFVRPFAGFLEKVVPARAVKETPHLTRLDVRLVESPVLAIETSKGEIVKMSQGVSKMLEWTREIINQEVPDDALTDKIFHREKIMDNVQSEVIEFITDLLTSEVPLSVTTEGRQQLRVADEYESISDYISSLLKAHLRIQQADLKLSSDQLTGLMQLHDDVAEYLSMVAAGFEHGQDNILSRAQTKSDSITIRVKELREAHLEKLTAEKVNPIKHMSYTAMLNGYRKIKDHALNVAEAVAGGK